MTDTQLLEAWYRYAAGAAGSIGEALRCARNKAFLFQEQQRSLIRIQGEQYNSLWLRLQAMPRPQFTTDLARIVAKVSNDAGIVATVDLNCLEEQIRAGSE